jgi:hypothetical protein
MLFVILCPLGIMNIAAMIAVTLVVLAESRPLSSRHTGSRLCSCRSFCRHSSGPLTCRKQACTYQCNNSRRHGCDGTFIPRCGH